MNATLFCVLGVALAATGPSGSAFYVPPAPLPAGVHGDVIWSRPLTGAAALASAASNTLVLYHTTAVDGRDVAVSGAVALPRGTPPAQGWPVISWAHGTTGNAPECAPTRADGPNDEQRYLDAWVARGFAVVQTDYEGQGVPGLHPYLVGEAAARDVTDIVRAARRLSPDVGKDWFVLGHSEGGSAAIFTAAVGPSWAPELRLEGAVSFAPASYIASVVGGLPHQDGTSRSLPFFLEMIEGIASTDPQIRLRDLLTPEAFGRLPALQSRCTDSLMDDDYWTSLNLNEIFRPGVDLEPLIADFTKNESNRVHADVPVLLVQGEADTIVSARITSYLDRALCANGTRVTYDLVPAKTHDTIVEETLADVETWVDRTRGGAPAPLASACNR